MGFQLLGPILGAAAGTAIGASFLEDDRAAAGQRAIRMKELVALDALGSWQEIEFRVTRQAPDRARYAPSGRLRLLLDGVEIERVKLARQVRSLHAGEGMSWGFRFQPQ